MKKAELEEQHRLYLEIMSKAERAFEAGAWWQGLESAVSALEYVDGVMQYSAKYEAGPSPDIAAIETILKYAPLVLDVENLNRLQTFLREERRVRRNLSDDIEQRVATARSTLESCYRFWSLLESNDFVRQDELSRRLGGEQRFWASIVAPWERVGLIRRVADGDSCRISIATQFDEEVRAKCPRCGTITRGAKRNFYQAVACSKCRNISLAVLVSG